MGIHGIGVISFNSFFDNCAIYGVCEHRPSWLRTLLSKIFVIAAKMLSVVNLADPNTGSSKDQAILGAVILLAFLYLVRLFVLLVIKALDITGKHLGLIGHFNLKVHRWALKYLNWLLAPPKREGPIENTLAESVECHLPVLLILSTNIVHVGYICELPSLTENIEDSSLSFFGLQSGRICPNRQIEITHSRMKDAKLIHDSRGIKPGQKRQKIDSSIEEHVGAEKVVALDPAFRNIKYLEKSLTISIPYKTVMEASIIYGPNPRIRFKLKDMP
ncbi:hypothetical protein [Teredinibacter turnerae]|uniref:hypothetical protein n=1 Tax=Teredinibacter turnerae TaxID=2426 RepID=UPI0012BCDD3D|nr:hypothetical protein [Teredinibacter turnerae]